MKKKKKTFAKIFFKKRDIHLNFHRRKKKKK